MRRRHVGDQPFAVLLGDDLIDPRETPLGRMLDVRDQYAGSVVALMRVDPAQIHLYDCAAVAPIGEDDVVRVTVCATAPVTRRTTSARWSAWPAAARISARRS